jgi:hypothetical protein
MDCYPRPNKTQTPKEYLEAVEPNFFFDSSKGIYKPKAYEPKDQGHGSKNQRPEWSRFAITTIISLLTLLAVAVYAYYAKLQWYEMRRAADAAHDSAVAANSAATTAAATLVASQQQFRNEQRPYVWLAPGIALPNKAMGVATLADLAKNKVFLEFNIEANNGGHSPAVNVINTAAVLIMDSSEKAKQRAREYIPKYGAPSDLAPNTGFYLPSTEKVTPTDKLLDDVRNDRVRIYVLARVQYWDIFAPKNKVPYETAFCGRVVADGMPLIACEGIKQSWVK